MREHIVRAIRHERIQASRTLAAFTFNTGPSLFVVVAGASANISSAFRSSTRHPMMPRRHVPYFYPETSATLRPATRPQPLRACVRACSAGGKFSDGHGQGGERMKRRNARVFRARLKKPIVRLNVRFCGLHDFLLFLGKARSRFRLATALSFQSSQSSEPRQKFVHERGSCRRGGLLRGFDPHALPSCAAREGDAEIFHQGRLTRKKADLSHFHRTNAIARKEPPMRQNERTLGPRGCGD